MRYELEMMDARREGHAEGLEEGRAKGLEEGRAKGLEEGRAKGLEEGLATGREDERLRSIKNLMKNSSCSARKAMDILEIPKEKQTYYLKKLQLVAAEE